MLKTRQQRSWDMLCFILAVYIIFYIFHAGYMKYVHGDDAVLVIIA